MTNFLKETIEFITKNNKTTDDVISIGTEKYRMSWNTFTKHANFEYDNGFGGCEIIKNIKIYGKNFIAFRNEYDGSEWWQLITIPENKQPNIQDNKNISFLANFEEEHKNYNGEKYTTSQTCHNFDVFYEAEIIKSKKLSDFYFDDYFY